QRGSAQRCRRGASPRDRTGPCRASKAARRRPEAPVRSGLLPHPAWRQAPDRRENPASPATPPRRAPRRPWAPKSPPVPLLITTRLKRGRPRPQPAADDRQAKPRAIQRLPAENPASRKNGRSLERHLLVIVRRSRDRRKAQAPHDVGRRLG